MEIDWNSPDAYELKPGIYRCRVKRCEQSASKSGDPKLTLSLIALDWGHANIADDDIMLAGKGLKYGLPRLVALGVPRGTREIDPSQLVGAEVFVAIHWHTWKRQDGSEGKMLKVDNGASPFCGYWPINQPPQNICLPSEPIPEPAPSNDVPF